jgi:hypothetical protein
MIRAAAAAVFAAIYAAGSRLLQKYYNKPPVFATQTHGAFAGDAGGGASGASGGRDYTDDHHCDYEDDYEDDCEDDEDTADGSHPTVRSGNRCTPAIAATNIFTGVVPSSEEDTRGDECRATLRELEFR